MADDKKIYEKLPARLQTTAIKNFFESTVEQLYSKANVDQIQGYIGSPSSDDVGVSGKFIAEPTTTKKFYALTPTVNTINSVTGESENLIFYDELIDTLETYGVNTLNHNKLFSENFATFLPPINIDKFLNYQEYYWYPRCPSTIDIAGTHQAFIDIEKDILGKQHYQPADGKHFRNGMVIRFTGNYVTPASSVDIEYIVNGVGEGIYFTEKDVNVSTRYTATSFTSTSIDFVYKQKGKVSNIATYTAPQPEREEDVGLPTTYINGDDAPGAQYEVKNVVVGSFDKYTSYVEISDGENTITVDYSTSTPANILELVSDIQSATGYDDLAFTVEVASRIPTDYTLQERGAKNKNHWSRVNYWFHRNNFLDAGDSLPNRGFRAERPIIEFDKDLELYQHGSSGALCCVLANAFNLTFEQLDGRHSALDVDGIPVTNIPKMIFSNEKTEIAKHIYKAYPVDSNDRVRVQVTDSGNANVSGFQASVQLEGQGRQSTVTGVTIENGGSGFTSSANVQVDIVGIHSEDATAVATVTGDAISSITVTNGGKGYYLEEQYRVEKLGTEQSEALGYTESDQLFDPLVATVGTTVQVRAGETQVGKEFYWNGIQWATAQEKLYSNQPPLFNLYSPEGHFLGDTAVYPESTFAGNKIFGYAETVPAGTSNMFKSTQLDAELNRYLVYKMFNAQSEIVFENFIETDKYIFRPPGVSAASGVTLGAENLNGPYSIEGYYPLYSNVEAAQKAGNGTVHEHVFYGKSFYMPNGLELGVTQFHGNYTGTLTPDFTTINTTNATVATPATVISSTSSGSGGNTY